ncbi:NUDIX hydrolase [Actinomarinicola tropica]|uniref:NUDIX domain-containing protein n=1 Tax=Actinomarinicola tropica TaxID=2789776 RepID=A0A5Q2RE96_9ACTN|nr:NUDIX hydrolase [Actinomarinicola tropica]QGG95228.1 NUDIX domain-containing protein [Actinomarinicola tropica]
MTDAGFRRVGEREIHRGYLVRLTESTFVGPDGDEFQRDVVHTPNAVGIVPVDRGPSGEWQVVLVRQYRGAVDREMWEIPAGMCDVEGESPEDTGRRELREEAGYDVRDVTVLTSFHPAPGFTTHSTAIVLGVGLTEVGREADGIEEQHMVVDRVPLDAAVERVRSGEITDGKTVVGLLLARERLDD